MIEDLNKIRQTIYVIGDEKYLCIEIRNYSQLVMRFTEVKEFDSNEWVYETGKDLIEIIETEEPMNEKELAAFLVFQGIKTRQKELTKNLPISFEQELIDYQLVYKDSEEELKRIKNEVMNLFFARKSLIKFMEDRNKEE